MDKLVINLAYSRCCFGGSDDHFVFAGFIWAHSLHTFLIVQLQISRALSLSVLFSALKLQQVLVNTGTE